MDGWIKGDYRLGSAHFIEKPVISHFVIIGDSLSDRGTLDHRYLLGFIPMRLVAGLAGKSPRGRFTNGFTWSDDFSATIADEFIIKRAEKNNALGAQHKYQFDNTDIADAILTHSQNSNTEPVQLDPTDVADNVIANRQFDRTIQNSYTLDNDLYVQYRGRDFVRSYDEGGLTAHDYRGAPSYSFTRFFSRLILATLDQKREKMLEHDRQLAIPDSQKQQTLILEWSGANDLITVNARPSREEADKAIQARILNAEKLILQGYRHFVLVDLPDLSLTPRYQNMTGAEGERERQNTKAICEYFNKKLTEECAKLQAKYKDNGCSIEVFAISNYFADVYQDTLDQTHRYPCHFEKDKIKQPYTKSKDFAIRNGLSPASGYMFWDDVHPTADLHEVLEQQLYKTYSQKYQFSAPCFETPKMLCYAFTRKFLELFASDVHGCFGLFRRTNVPQIDFSQPTTAIVSILRHALYNNGKRTRKALTELQWIDGAGNINTQIPALKDAKDELDAVIKQGIRR